MRKAFGNTWWGKQWLNSLNQIDYSNRLPRGRRYANNGSVKSIEIKGNNISGAVKGTRPRPYKITIDIPKFSAREKAKIVELVTTNPLFLSQLLNRKLPSELNNLCKAHQIHIFPASWNDLNGKCSCPDWAVPCKHMAAVLYLVANEIDKNPFVVFDLHEFDLFKGLAGVGYTLEGQKEINILSVDKLRQPLSSASIKMSVEEEAYNRLDFTLLPESREALLTLLSENPVFYPEGNFKDLLAKVYKTVARSATKLKSLEETSTDRVLDQIDEVELFIEGDMTFSKCVFRDHRGKSLKVFKKLEELSDWLRHIPISNLAQYATNLSGLYWVYRFSAKLVEQSAYIPQLLRIGSKFYHIRWIPALLNEHVRELFSLLGSLVPTGILYYKDDDIYEPIKTDALLSLCSVFITYFVQTHHNLGHRYADDELADLFFRGDLIKFGQFETREYPAAIQLWLNKFFIVEKTYVPLLKVDDLEGEFEVNLAVEDKQNPLESPIELKQLLKEDTYGHIRLGVLRDIAMLAEYFPQISSLLASGGEESLIFDSEEFVAVLFKILPVIELFGIKVLLPKALRKLLRPQLSMTLEAEDDGTVKLSSVISLENMLLFKWRVAIGDQLLSAAQFLKMVKRYAGIVNINDQYVYFDQKEIQALIDKLENPPELKGNELLQIALAEDYQGAKVMLNKQARRLINRLMGGEGTEVPQQLLATLRPYQLRGYEWLYKNARLGFGSLLADDMGLGKTIQVISTLLKLKEDGELGARKAIIIVPTTLLTNWQKEIQKFAPTLSTHTYHGSSRSLDTLAEIDILITTYGVARSEATQLSKKKWLVLVIDEAQNIKNPATAQTKAIKKIKAPIKIAMSGTPVENRMSEYWSIFDFANKGYLNTLKKFKTEYAAPIEIDRDHRKLKRFKQITAPFILRRLKSDRSIIKDLPNKIEQDQFCSLSKEQAAVYQNVLDTTLDSVAEAEGISRSGNVLKLITALKQVCNHPKQFLKKGEATPERSGKAERLLGLVDSIFEQGEKLLIFTQYQEMGKLIVEMLHERFQLEAPFLHGGLSRKKRDEMVEDFQGNRSTRAMILSLKAGGTGLNLTAANNVIHYDLWWNPAVEAQATDRAYRIGQTRNVMVHRFITQGTFEEKINKLLLDKKELADLTVATGEKWIGELSNRELKQLVKLG